MTPELLRYVLIFVGIMALMRWARGGPRWRRRWREAPIDQYRSEEELRALENRVSLVERLETRVEELENRLDFTERLLANRPPADLPTPR